MVVIELDTITDLVLLISFIPLDTSACELIIGLSKKYW